MKILTIVTTVALTLIVAAMGTVVRSQDPPDEAGAAAEEAANPYRVGMEDVLDIVVWGEPDLSRTVTVRPDGMITLPLIGDVAVEGLSTDTIRDLLAGRLAKFVRDPNVAVIVAQIRSFRVFVLGEVNSQGVLDFQRPTRLLQAIATAGGLTAYSKKEVTILRQLNGRETRIKIDLKPLLSRDSTDNLLLKPDDTLVVF